MMKRIALAAALIGIWPALLLAHHGWGSYDSKSPVTVVGKILTSVYENPHATITVQAPDKVWTVTLAPTSRMRNRGALAEMIAVGTDVSAYGYPSTAQPNEMRAERITSGGKTIEMR
jgi:hypothetical protein